MKPKTEIPLSELLKQITPPLSFVPEMSGYARVYDGNGIVIIPLEARLSSKDAAYLTHCANLFPELVEASKRYVRTWSVLENLRVTSCGKKVEDAETDFIDAALGMQSILARAEKVKLP